MGKRNLLSTKRFASCSLAISLLAACTSTNWVREPLKAGSWYSDNPGRLAATLDKLLRNADNNIINSGHTGKLCSDNPNPGGQPMALICPHAAYKYSGQAAAHGFELLKGRTINRVFVLGPRHFSRIEGALLSSARSYATPLGPLPVDTSVVERLKELSGFSVDDKSHSEEYSLELELPFLRRMFGEVKIVPIIIGGITTEGQARIIGNGLLEVLTPGDVVVASSDFTHYGDYYGYVPFTDNVRENIRALDKRAYSFISRRDVPGLLKFKAETNDTICGLAPICVLLTMLPSNAKATLLDYYTSQDVALGFSPLEAKRSISYMAIAFTGGRWNKATVSTH